MHLAVKEEVILKGYWVVAQRGHVGGHRWRSASVPPDGEKKTANVVRSTDFKVNYAK